ncbi:MAG: ribonuclease III [Acidimicrobiaceae bacterium]|nr:ribonuclease III [Acidimicrobiaceae bacterium]
MPLTMSSLVSTDPEIGKQPVFEKETRLKLEEGIGYKFNDIGILSNALRHRSWCSENEGNSNERLEFLGDAVLGLLVAKNIFENYPDKPEGDLAKIRAGVVSSQALCEVAQEIDLGNAVALGVGEESAQGRQKESILADAFEAVLGAVFLDGGIESAKLVVEKLFSKRIALTALEPGLTDYKTRLQELTMQISEPAPIYFVDADGPDHEKSFCATVEIGTHRFGPTYGTSKKKAEQAAASLAYSFFEFEEKGEKN